MQDVKAIESAMNVDVAKDNLQSDKMPSDDNHHYYSSMVGSSVFLTARPHPELTLTKNSPGLLVATRRQTHMSWLKRALRYLT